MLGMQAGADRKSLFGALSLFLRSVTKGAHVSNSRLGTYWCQTFEKKKEQRQQVLPKPNPGIWNRDFLIDIDI